jgi:hypothetical protein
LSAKELHSRTKNKGFWVKFTLCNPFFFLISYEKGLMRNLYAVALLLLTTPAFSQSILIKGKVRADDESNLPGVTVVLKGSSMATSTDQKGDFSLTAPRLPATLVFTAVGYKTKQLVVKKTDSAKFLAVVMYAANISLEEVVVVGYGTSRKRSVAGSTPVLEGKVAGVSVTSRSKARADDSYKPVSPANGRSKVLTAGELSDFKKWKLWEGYSNEEFKDHSEHWGIRPVNRYCVQIQNSEHKAIAGEKVYLVNLFTRDTAWRAVTDNTGKAELWANLAGTDEDLTRYSIVCGNQSLRYPTVFENGINRLTLNKECGRANSADIAFVVDATGSMGDEIRYLQEELQDVIANIADKNKGITLRTGSVFYRDKTDDYVTRALDFQTDPSSLISFIKNQSAGGGGDFPEAVDEALTVALNKLQWDKNARAKILFLVLDAPPHDDATEKMKKLMIQAAAMGVRIVPVVCSGIDKSTEYLMRSIALTTNGSYIFLTDDSGVGNKHIKPTTDNFTVELLNDIIQRVIGEMVFMAPCDSKEKITEPANPDNNHTNVVVYPNPSAGRININSPGKIEELYITDFTGKILERINTGGKLQTWQTDLSNYPSGTYLVRYFTEKKGWGVKKVLLIK